MSFETVGIIFVAIAAFLFLIDCVSTPVALSRDDEEFLDDLGNPL